MLKLAMLIKKKFRYSYVGFDFHMHSTGNKSITFKAYNTVEFVTAKSLNQLTEILISRNWINREDLEPKKREIKDKIINKGKL